MSEQFRPAGPDAFAGITVNERLFVAGLLEDYDRLRAAKDEIALNRLLAKVGLRFENGMHWEITDAQDR